MFKTVTSLFHDQHKANATLSRLEQAGISRSNVTVYSDASSNLTEDLGALGIPASVAHAYAEGIRRGGSLVTVRCDDDQVDRVVSILDGDDGILDLDEQQTSWRSEGWQGHSSASSGTAGGLGAAAAGLGSALTGHTDRTNGRTAATGLRAGGTSTDAVGTTGREEVIPIVEEELHVGKREANRGRVRIHSHVVERPVQEQVSLRDETVEVERRAASGATGSLSGDPFRERTVEVEEHDEEAVVSKEARVKEELVVRKDVEQRTQTVSDTVRRTEVDVEDERGARGADTPGSTDRKR